MNHDVKPAVIVVNWNSGTDLLKCLSALRDQTLQPARIVVVDNASTDGSAADLEKRFPEVEIVSLDKNIGFAAANNLAVDSVAECDWIAFLNPDAFARADWLENLVRAAGENPDVSLFGSHMLRHGKPDEVDGTGDIYHVSGLAWRRDHDLKAAHVGRESGEIFSPCAAAALVRQSAFQEAGGFDESYFCYFEDVDFSFRLRLRGHRCLYVADAVVEHVGSASTDRYSDFAVYHGNRNLVWTYFKNMPGILFWVYLPQHLLANFAAVLWFSLRGQGKTVCRAKWDALKGLPRALAQRKKNQAGRRVSVGTLRRSMARGLLLPYLRPRGPRALG